MSGFYRLGEPGSDTAEMSETRVEHKRDCIFKSDFSALAIQGLRRFLEDHDGHDMRLTGSLESWSFLFFQLREAEDKPEWFPRGKWATIHHLEALLTEAARCPPKQKRSGWRLRNGALGPKCPHCGQALK